eukprot:m.288391 g.288391  ORF g.288391 m.288391 type:complete len:226 (+) comp19960_c0_seq11:177-854(+)
MNTTTHCPRPSSDGSIQLILGPMFSGKSTELLRRIKRYSIAKNRCLVIKYINDTRYSKDRVSTHDRQEFEATAANKLFDVERETDDVDIVGIDEGQFFPDLVPFAEKMASVGKTVIIGALDGTFQRKPFGTILELVPMAEHVVKLNAVCFNCGADAPFSKRIVDDTAVEVIGGADKYVAACRRCFTRPNSEQNPQTPQPATTCAASAEDEVADDTKRQLQFAESV